MFLFTFKMTTVMIEICACCFYVDKKTCHHMHRQRYIDSSGVLCNESRMHEIYSIGNAGWCNVQWALARFCRIIWLDPPPVPWSSQSFRLWRLYLAPAKKENQMASTRYHIPVRGKSMPLFFIVRFWRLCPCFLRKASKYNTIPLHRVRLTTNKVVRGPGRTPTHQ